MRVTGQHNPVRRAQVSLRNAGLSGGHRHLELPGQRGGHFQQEEVQRLSEG